MYDKTDKYGDPPSQPNSPKNVRDNNNISRIDIIRGSLRVERPHYQQNQLNDMLNYVKPNNNICRKVKSYCKSIEPVKCIVRSVPVLDWLPRYQLKNWIVGDIISGMTVAIMHIPQGMGYALLSNVPPVVGIYTAFFPVLTYFLLGTARHNSMGSFALISLMTGKIVMTYSNMDYSSGNSFNATDGTIMETGTDPPDSYSPVEVATAVSLMVGIFQILMYVMRLGILSSLLSETLISGFTTAAAFHVLTSQVKDVFGLNLPPVKESMFKLIYTYIAIFKGLDQVNYAAMITSAVTICVLFFNNEVLRIWVAKRCHFPIPIELIAVISGTLVSRFGNLEELYGIPTVGHIPTGFPEPTVPRGSLLATVAVESFPIAMVSFTVAMSMALIFAQKLGYSIDSNQELLAQGSGNIVGSFFSCIPFSASISRSMIQEKVGGKTQLASVISCALLAVVLLWVGPFFEPLPKCVLASIIIVALKGMLVQVVMVKKFAKLNKFDALVWIVTFCSVIIISIDIGLLIGVILSLASLIIQAMKPYTCLLGNMPNTDLYLDTKRYKGTVEIPHVKIFHYCGGLNFASRTHFNSELYRLVHWDTEKKLQEPSNIKCVILDFSAVSYIDPSGVGSLRDLVIDFQKLNIYIYLACCSCPVYETLQKCDIYEKIESVFTTFPTIHDAVHSANKLSKI